MFNPCTAHHFQPYSFQKHPIDVTETWLDWPANEGVFVAFPTRRQIFEQLFNIRPPTVLKLPRLPQVTHPQP